MISNVFAWTTIVLNMLTLLNALYNCVRYLWNRKVTKMLVLLFYVMVAVDTITISIIVLDYILNPEGYLDSTIFVYANLGRTLGLAATYWLDGLTMLWLSISLRRMLRKTTSASVKRNMYLLTATTIIFSLVYTPIAFVFRNQHDMHIVRLIADISILSINTVILVYLTIQLKHFGANAM